MLVTELLNPAPTEATVTELLREVIDPAARDQYRRPRAAPAVAIAPGGTIRVVTTLTTPACPLGPYITEQIVDLLSQVTTITDVDVEVVWSPPWNPDHDMTDHAKELLGWRR